MDIKTHSSSRRSSHNLSSSLLNILYRYEGGFEIFIGMITEAKVYWVLVRE